MDLTILQQGRFTSTGANTTIQLRSDLDWMQTYNYTQIAGASGSGQVVQAYWQRGLAAGYAFTWSLTASTLALVPTIVASGGFTLVDSSLQSPGLLVSTITAISNASIPVVTNTGTNGLIAGNVVRLINVAGAQQLGGIDFTVGYNTLSTTTFSLDYMAQIVAGTTGSWRQINFDPIFYPRRRTITKISNASQAVVTLSVTHGFTVGQAVRFAVPSAFGMTQISGLQGTIVAVNTATTNGNTVTVNIDSTNFSTFAWPLTSSLAFTPAELIPVGEDSAEALALAVNPLGDATVNQGYIGMILGGGSAGPAGSSSDVIYWTAGKSFSVNNQ